MGPSWGHFGAILGPSRAISGILWPSWAISGPSRGHITSILRHFMCMPSEDGWCIVDFAKCAPRLGETPVLGLLGSVLAPSSFLLGTIFGPSWAILGHLRPFWAHLGSFLAVLSCLRATLCPLGVSICDGIADWSRFGPRLHELPILLSCLGSNLDFLGCVLGRLVRAC